MSIFKFGEFPSKYDPYGTKIIDPDAVVVYTADSIWEAGTVLVGAGCRESGPDAGMEGVIWRISPGAPPTVEELGVDRKGLPAEYNPYDMVFDQEGSLLISVDLGTKNDGRALRTLAPLLCMIEDLPDWSRRDRSALARALRAKDAPSEARAARLFTGHPRLGDALRTITQKTF